MDPVLVAGELPHVQLVGHRGNQLLDQGRSLWTHEVRAEKLPSGAVCYQLAYACVIFHSPAVGNVAKVLDLDGDVEALLSCLLLS